MTKSTVSEVTRPLDQADGAKIQTPAQLAAIDPDTVGMLLCAVDHANVDDVAATLRDFLQTFSAFGEVPNLAGLSTVPVTEKLVRVASNRLFYRTINGGATWLVTGRRCDVTNNTELASLDTNELVDGQLVDVIETGWLWQWTTADGWVSIRQ